MGIVTTNIRLQNPKKPQLLPIEIKAMADTEAMHLCIPEHVALQLQLEEIYKREVITADSTRHLCPYVGPVQVTFANRGCFTGAIVIDSEVLLGAVPTEDMDLVVYPSRQTVEINPDSPNIPSSVAKGTRQILSDSPVNSGILRI